MRIAICDDDLGCCNEISVWLKEFEAKTSGNYHIKSYISAESFMKDWSKGENFDLILLDIELPGKSGIELGDEIRKYLQSNLVSIVFISGKENYCMELFHVEPLNFHLKPLKKEEIWGDIEKIQRRRREYQRKFYCQESGIQRAISIDRILYIEAKEKVIEITLCDYQKIVIRDKLSRIGEELRDDYICQCHRSYLINLQHVKRYKKQQIYFENGDSIPVGKKFINEWKRAWHRYEMEVL